MELAYQQAIPIRNQRNLAFQDIKSSITSWRIWLMLAYQDIKLRYRRSVLGPFWITLSMAITVYSMGYLYSHLFKIEVESYFPFLVTGMIAWTLISTQITELTDAFVTSDGLIKQLKLPYVIYIHRVAMRNMIIFLHNLLVFVPIAIIFHKAIAYNWHTLMLIPGLLVLYINSICYGLVLATLGARYRDISQIIKSLVQVVFFVTPVMWNPSTLPADSRYIVFLNPFYSFIELIRAPLLGQALTTSTLLFVGGITLLGFVLSFKIFQRYRTRIVYWL